MKRHSVTLFSTKNGRFVSCGAVHKTTYVVFQIPESLFNEIVGMLERDRLVVERLEKLGKNYTEIRLKHISHVPVAIVLRSEEDTTMLRYYLNCETLTESKFWPLAAVEEVSESHFAP